MYAHGTTHFNLPLTSGEDTRDWFDTNQAFEDVDAALWAAEQDAEGAKEDLTSVKEDVATLQSEAAAEKTRVDTVISDVSALSTVVIQQGTDIGDAKQDLEDMICPTQESSATASVEHAEGSYFIYNDTLYQADELISVGTLIVPDSNCHTTSVTDNLGGGGGGAVIDDSTTSTSTVWSSSKTHAEMQLAHVGDTRFASGKLQYYNGTTWVDIPIGGGEMVALDFANPLHTFNSNASSYTASGECYLVGTSRGTSTAKVTVNGTSICCPSASDSAGQVTTVPTVKLTAGDVVVASGLTQTYDSLHVFAAKS